MPIPGTKELVLARATVRTLRALQLRIAGLSYEDVVDVIRKELPDSVDDTYDAQECSREVTASLSRYRQNIRERSAEIIELELLRLDQLEMVWLQRALDGEQKAANVVLRIMERRSKYLGLDQPTKIKMTDWRTEVIDLIRSGKITIEQVRKEMGDDVVKQLVESGSLGLPEGREAKDTITGESQELAGKTLALGDEPASPVPSRSEPGVGLDS